MLIHWVMGHAFLNSYEQVQEEDWPLSHDWRQWHQSRMHEKLHTQKLLGFRTVYCTNSTLQKWTSNEIFMVWCLHILHRMSNSTNGIFVPIVKSSDCRNLEYSFRHLVVDHSSTGRLQRVSRDLVSHQDTLKKLRTYTIWLFQRLTPADSWADLTKN